MSAEENKAFIRRYFDAISGQDKPPALLDAYLSDETLKHHITMAETGFPQYELVAEDMIAEGDQVVVRAILRGTHRGEFQGIPPTGKQVSMPFMIIYQLADEKIVQHWMVADSLGLLQQLGVIPTPESAAA